MGELRLMEDGVCRGTIRIREDPVRVHFSVCCPDLGGGLYKVWLVGASGRMLLGTPEPSGNCLVLERACSAAALRAAGVCPPVCGELTVAGKEGVRGSQKAVTPEDPELRRVLEKSPPGRWNAGEGGWLLSWPWQVGEELPAPSLACLGWSGLSGGREHFFLSLNEKGWPIHKSSRNRKG